MGHSGKRLAKYCREEKYGISCCLEYVQFIPDKSTAAIKIGIRNICCFHFINSMNYMGKLKNNE